MCHKLQHVICSASLWYINMANQPQRCSSDLPFYVEHLCGCFVLHINLNVWYMSQIWGLPVPNANKQLIINIGIRAAPSPIPEIGLGTTLSLQLGPRVALGLQLGPEAAPGQYYWQSVYQHQAQSSPQSWTMSVISGMAGCIIFEMGHKIPDSTIIIMSARRSRMNVYYTLSSPFHPLTAPGKCLFSHCSSIIMQKGEERVPFTLFFSS